MSKEPYSDKVDDDDLPPPYSPNDTGSHQATLFSAHLGSLRDQIDSEQAARSLSRDDLDSQALALIIPHLEEALSAIASIHPQPGLVVTTFVPAAAVSQDWKPVEENDEIRGEIHNTIRVTHDKKFDGDRERADQPSTAGQAKNSEFDGWGRWQSREGSSSNTDTVGQMWWSDEDKAHRLAKHLQPEGEGILPGGKAMSPRPRDEKLPKPSKRRNILDRLANMAPEPLVSGKSSAEASSSRQGKGANVSLTIKAEEVTFRKENDFGLWESRTGWGIVARVRLGRG